MKFFLFISLSIWQIYFARETAANADNNDQKCPFQKTVNLTEHHRYDNGSYLYQGILIPPEKQDFYNYELLFRKAKHDVPLHVRGCVCDKQPCMKLCCRPDEFLNGTQCEKLTPKMEVSWELPILFLKNNNIKTVNILDHFTTQIGKPCPSLEALVMELDKWVLQENGKLLIEIDGSNLDTIDYCFSPELIENKTNLFALTPFSCPIKNVVTWQLLLNTYGMTVSVLFLIPTIVVYLILKELRGNLRGKLLICYLLSLTVGYGIISFINIFQLRFGLVACSMLGFTCYFFFLSAFLWLSVLCFDIWKNFRDTNIELNSKKNHVQFFFYSLYAWGIAAAATATIIAVEWSDVDEIYKPGIGVEMCWLNTEKWSASIYFYGPNLVILLFNFATFAHLTNKIYKVRRDVAKLTHKEKFIQENALVVLRLFLIMGISWLFDILSYCLREYEKWEFMFILSDFANATQGVLIFSLFVLKPNVKDLLRKRFRKSKGGNSKRSVSTSTTNFSKLQSSISAQSPITP